jgi:hypothetical protein
LPQNFLSRTNRNKIVIINGLLYSQVLHRILTKQEIHIKVILPHNLHIITEELSLHLQIRLTSVELAVTKQMTLVTERLPEKTRKRGTVGKVSIR